jgi:hypothetical protein
VRWRLSERFEFTGNARLHYFFYNVGAQRSLGYWEFLTLVKYRF